jgi:hypothetical protein
VSAETPNGDRTLARLMVDTMSEGYALRQALDKAEAEEQRLARDHSGAVAQTVLARQRYEMNRDLARSIWETLREEIIEQRWKVPPPTEQVGTEIGTKQPSPPSP